MSVVYPRLDAAVAPQLLAECTGLTMDDLAGRSAVDHARATYYETASRRVSQDDLRRLQVAVRSLAAEYGYPEVRAGRSFTAFDQRLSLLLYREMDIVTADAADDRVWSFLSLVLLPDVALWRYPNTTGRTDFERILGRPRNVFRRLWWRAHVLGEDVTVRIGEDQAVAIMERPKTLGGDPRIANHFASATLDRIAATPDLSGSDIMRDAAKRLLRVLTVVTAGALPDHALAGLMSEVLDEAVAAVRDERTLGRDQAQPAAEVASADGVGGNDDRGENAGSVAPQGWDSQLGGTASELAGGLVRGLLRRVRGTNTS